MTGAFDRAYTYINIYTENLNNCRSQKNFFNG